MDLLIIEKELNKLIDKAIKENEVPVAALIVKENKIISKAYNKVNKSNNILDHAEILAIKKASKKIKNWRLIDCDLYVTLEPCAMCKEIIKKSRLNNVYYFLNQNQNKTESDIKYKKIKNNTNFSDKLVNFFKQKR